MFFGVDVTLRDVSNGSGDAGQDEETFTQAFDIDWAGAAGLNAGYYTLRLSDEPSSTFLSANLLMDSGLGFNRKEVVRLNAQRSAGGWTFNTILIAKPAAAIRLEISSTERHLAVTEARLRRMTRPEFYARLAVRAFVRQRQANRSLFQTVSRCLSLVRTSGIKGLATELRRSGQIGDTVSYGEWLSSQTAGGEDASLSLQERLASLSQTPNFSVVMPVYNTPERLLTEAIDSVRGQIYENWELCIADDGSQSPAVREILSQHAALDSRIKVVFCETNQGIAAATNAAFTLATGEWVAMLDHDDLLDPAALAEVALHLEHRPDDQIVYSDEDKLDLEGNRYEPYFKSDYSRELFRSQNYFNHLTLHRAENIRTVGGWRDGFAGSQDYDLNLRILERVDGAHIGHIPKVLYHWRAVKGSTAQTTSAKRYAHASGQRALEEHIERTGLNATVEPQNDTAHYRIRLAVPEPQPLVSLIIATKDMVDLLRLCVESIVEKTTYPNYEIVLVDNNSVERATHDYLDALASRPNFRILRYPAPFNFSAINNFAVKHASGSIVGLINNDIEVISPDWLTEMVSWALQPDVGCVGAKLYYPNDTIQHAGVIIGLGGVAGHSHKHFPREQSGYFSRLKDIQNLSAVTGACLLVRKEIYERAKGLNEVDLKIAFNDVDFCLRVREMGFVNVWTPYAELYHHESMSRGPEDNPEKIERFGREIDYMRRRWDLRRDPYYSPHLTLDREDFSLAIASGARIVRRTEEGS